MLSPRQSFLVSLGGHIAVVLVLLVGGLVVAHKFMRPEPIEVDLFSTLTPGSGDGGGAQEGPKEPEKQPEAEVEPEIVEREVPKEPTFDPTKSINLSEVPKVEHEELTPYEPTPTVRETGNGSTPGGAGGGGSYKALIKAACERNWTPPPRGLLGRPLPSTEVEIVVERNGRIVGRRITRASGNAEFDRTVLEAIDLSNPLPAFPPELKGARETFNILFEVPKG